MGDVYYNHGKVPIYITIGAPDSETKYLIMPGQGIDLAVLGLARGKVDLCPGCGYPWSDHVLGEQGSSICAPKVAANQACEPFCARQAGHTGNCKPEHQEGKEK